MPPTQLLCLMLLDAPCTVWHTALAAIAITMINNHLVICLYVLPLQFKVVFDAVYTPRDTRLLRDAVAAGCLIADGVAMFVGQAVEQFKLFTGSQQPPVQLMEDVVVGNVSSN